MPLCECGCGESTVSASFKPGHDQKLRTDLEHRVGGLIALRSLVHTAEEYSAGAIDESSLVHRISALMHAAQG